MDTETADPTEVEETEEQEETKEEAQIEEGRLDVDGVNIHFGKSGRGKHYVLFLHDAPASYSIDFDRAIEEFDQDEFTLVGWDAPGLGRSVPPKRDHTHGYHEREARQAFRLMETMGLVPFSVVAKGDGGQTALWMGYQQRNTDNIRKLVMWSTSAYISESQAKKYDSPVRECIELWAEWKKRPYVDLYGEEYFTEVWQDYLAAKISWYRDKALKGNVCQHILAEIPQPTLLIFPEHEYFCDEDEMDDMEEAMPNAHVLFAEDMHHDFNQKKFDWFRSKITRFLLAGEDREFELVKEENRRLEKTYFSQMKDSDDETETHESVN